MRLLILALLAICCMAAYTVEGVGSEVPDRTICVSLHTRPLPVQKIKSYTIKEGSLKAVIFVTKRGLKICADPQAKWVRTAVRHLNNKPTTRRNMVQTKPMEAQQSTNTAVTFTG